MPHRSRPVGSELLQGIMVGLSLFAMPGYIASQCGIKKPTATLLHLINQKRTITVDRWWAAGAKKLAAAVFWSDRKGIFSPRFKCCQNQKQSSPMAPEKNSPECS